MVLEVAPNRAGLGHDRDAMHAEVIRVTDTGQHQQLGRVDRAATQDDLALAADNPRDRAVCHLDSGRRAVLDDDPPDERLTHDLEIAPQACWS